MIFFAVSAIFAVKNRYWLNRPARGPLLSCTGA